MTDHRIKSIGLWKALAAFCKLSLWLIFLSPTPLALAETPVIEILATDQAQRLMLDNPRKLLELLEPVVTQERGDLKAWMHLRAQRLYVEALMETGDTLPLKEWIPRLHKQLNFSDDPLSLSEALLIQSILIQEGVDLSTQEAKEEAFQNILARAHEAGLYGVQARILTRFSIFLTDKGAVLQSMELQNEIQDLIRKSPDLYETDQIIIKSAMAQLYQRTGQIERSVSLMIDVLGFATQHNLRYLAATTQFNVGSYHEKRNEPDSMDKALAAYEISRTKAQQIDDHITVGTSLLGLARVSIEKNEVKKAIDHLDQALSIFEQKKHMVWLGEAYLTLGRALSLAGRHREAGEALEFAEIYFPPDYGEDQNRILEQKAYNLFALGNKDAAFITLKDHIDLYKKQHSETFNRDVSQLMVSLGLKVAEDRNSLLIKENELQQQKLASAERLKSYMVAVLGLSVLLIGFLGFSLWSVREVKRSRRKLQRILDNIDEGILTVDRSLRIEPYYSQHVQKIFDESDELSGVELTKPLTQYSKLHPEAISLLRESLLASVDNGLLTWELNSGHIPIEMSFHNRDKQRHVTINWVPLLNKGQQIEGFLLGLRDVTERRLLEAEIREERLKSDRLTSLLRELLKTDRTRASELLHQVAALLASPYTGSVGGLSLEASRRAIHTHKGVARSLGLWELSRFLHFWEDQWPVTRDLPMSEESWASLLGMWHDLYRDYSKLLHDLLEGHSAQENQPRDSLFGIVSIKSHLLSQHLKEHDFRDFSVTVRDSIINWPRAITEVLEKVLIHALINAADHGYILPSKHGATLREPVFLVEALRQSSQVEIRVTDQGVGINIAKISQLAEQLHLPTGDTSSIMEVLFQDGITTADQVTHTSGRGVGLPAIRSMVSEVQGRVRLEPNSVGTGTTLIMEFPASLFSNHADCETGFKKSSAA